MLSSEGEHTDSQLPLKLLTKTTVSLVQQGFQCVFVPFLLVYAQRRQVHGYFQHILRHRQSGNR